MATSCNLHAGAGLTTTWHLRRGAEAVEVRMHVRSAVPDPAMNYQLALDGVDVATLAQWMVRRDLEKRKLVRLLPDWELEPVRLNAVYPTRLSSSPKVRAFLEFVRERRPRKLCLSSEHFESFWKRKCSSHEFKSRRQWLNSEHRYSWS